MKTKAYKDQISSFKGGIREIWTNGVENINKGKVKREEKFKE